MHRLFRREEVLLSCCLGIAIFGAYGHSAVAKQKPVNVAREYIRPKGVTTWVDMVAQSDIVAEVVVISSAGGETKYYGNFMSVVTANEVRIDRLLFRSRTARADVGERILVLTPGGLVDRGEYMEHVIVEGSEPWPAGTSYILALKWDGRLKAWRPTAYYESVFKVMPDGTLTTTGYGPVAREAVRLGRAAIASKVEEAAAQLRRGQALSSPR